MLESPYNQPVACCFFNKRLRHRRFLVDIAKLSRTSFLQEHLETPDFVFMEHICDYNIKFNVNKPNQLFQPFETLINIEMHHFKSKVT